MQPTYADTIQQKWRTVLLFGVIAFFVITALTVFLLPFEFRARTQLFMLPENMQDVDSYTSVKAAERLGENLNYLVGTSSFFDLVMAAGKDKINSGYFPTDPRLRLKKWNRMVSAVVVPGTGLLQVSVFHADKNQARVVAQTISDVLVFRGKDYTGFNVGIRQVDAVIVSPFPARPFLPLYAVVGFLIGAVIGAVYVVMEKNKVLSRGE